MGRRTSPKTSDERQSPSAAARNRSTFFRCPTCRLVSVPISYSLLFQKRQRTSVSLFRCWEGKVEYFAVCKRTVLNRRPCVTLSSVSLKRVSP